MCFIRPVKNNIIFVSIIWVKIPHAEIIKELFRLKGINPLFMNNGLAQQHNNQFQNQQLLNNQLQLQQSMFRMQFPH
jgi:hypothetical protein